MKVARIGLKKCNLGDNWPMDRGKPGNRIDKTNPTYDNNKYVHFYPSLVDPGWHQNSICEASALVPSHQY